MPKSTITWNGVSSDTLGITIERFPNIIRAAKRYETVNIPGKNGAMYIYDDAYDNYNQEYQIYAGTGERGNLPASFMDIMQWLMPRQSTKPTIDDYNNLTVNGYKRLIDSYEPDVIRLAAFNQSLNFQNAWNRYGEGSLIFNVRPERFRTDAFDRYDVTQEQEYSERGARIEYNADDIDNAMRKFYVLPSALQSGSGTPTPDNVRPIVATSTPTYYNTGNGLTDVYDCELGEAIYGGYFEDEMSFTAYITHKSIIVSDYTWSFSSSGGTYRIYRAFTSDKPQHASAVPIPELACSMLPYGGWVSSTSELVSGNIYQMEGSYMIYIVDNSCTSLSAFMEKYGNAQIVYPVRVPDTTYGAGYEEISTYDGINVLYTEMGELEITDSGLWIDNPTSQDARPVIIFHGAGNSNATTVQINGSTISFPYGLRGLAGPLYMDCENMNYYFRLYTDDSSRLLNLTINKFPTLKPGINNIYVSGTAFSSIEVIPRWWDL